MLPNAIWLMCLAAATTAGVRAQDSSSTTDSSDTSTMTTETFSALTFTNSYSVLTGSDVPTYVFTGSGYTYATVGGQVTRSTTSSSTATVSGSSNGTASSSNSQITASTHHVSLTQIGGGIAATATSNSTTTNSTASSTSSAAAPTNTVPCNGFPEFCTRQYSNITMVASHNSAFVVPNNAASNQELPIIDQLNDGIRMLQGQVQWENGTTYNCHTSCSQLNAGPWQDGLEIVRSWLQENPYEVLTILIGNSDFTVVENFVPAITNAGLLPYVYEPTYIPQHRDQWPTLGEMILTNKRLVFFMDYNANQTSVPYILDEFTHIWETPFSPTDQAFPCTQQRPPDLDADVARDQFMNLANHNLNTAVDLSSVGISTSEPILIPNTAELNLTNGEQVGLFGTLGTMNQNCTGMFLPPYTKTTPPPTDFSSRLEMWNRAPNFLLVDYYNRGSPSAGSVFQVAARANNVTYTQDCCGNVESSASSIRFSMALAAVAVGFVWLVAG